MKLWNFLLKRETEVYFLFLSMLICFVVIWQSGIQASRLDRNWEVMSQNHTLLLEVKLAQSPGTSIEWSTLNTKIQSMSTDVRTMIAKLDTAMAKESADKEAAAVLARAKVVAGELSALAVRVAEKLKLDGAKKK